MVDRVAVIGNCQAWPVSQYLGAITSKTEFQLFSLNQIKGPKALAEAVEQLSAFDLVLTQDLTGADLGPLRTTELRTRYPGLVLYPQMIFSGFHPDVLALNPKAAAGPLGGASDSLLIAAAYSSGVPVERVSGLFNAYIFARLGYFDEYPKARAYFLSVASQAGYDMADELDGWLKDGPFMHTPVHPTLRAIAGIASRVAERAGLATRPPVGPVKDLLGRSTVLPVYPEIAQRIGVTGGSTFKRAAAQAHDGRDLSLEQFVGQAYALYATLPPKIFDQPKINEIAAVLREELV